MHIAICRLLEPYGYYEFDFRDADGWPHYKVLKELPSCLATRRTNGFDEGSHCMVFQFEKCGLIQTLSNTFPGKGLTNPFNSKFNNVPDNLKMGILVSKRQ